MAWAAEEERATARKMTTTALENIFYRLGIKSSECRGKDWS